jgi:outer membrane protein assembly factor BamB
MTALESNRRDWKWVRAALALTILLPLHGGAVRADCLCGTAADDLTADRAGLEREWLVQIPFDASTATLAHVVIDRDLVVAQAGDGNVVAVQAGEPRAGTPVPGTILWKHPLDARTNPFQPAAIGADIVAVSHGDGIHAFDRKTGQALWSSRFGLLADAGAAVSGPWVYAPFGVGKIMRLPTNPNRQPAAGEGAAPAPDAAPAKKQASKKKGRSAAPKPESLEPLSLEAGGAVSQQPQPFHGGVLWCTDDGTLVAIEPVEDGWSRNDFYLDTVPAGRPLVHDGAIFAATAEGDLVRIDTVDTTGGGLRLKWRVLLDARPEGTLFAAGEKLVVSLGDDGIAVFSTTTGEQLGRTWRHGRIVAVAAGRIWLVDRVGRLVSIDLETGEKRDQFCLGGFTFPVVNQATDRLILASPSGALVSLKAK